MWEHREYVMGYAVEPIGAGDLVETYERSWRERLLSWPWRPWVKKAVRKSTLAQIIKLREQTQADIRAVTGIDNLCGL